MVLERLDVDVGGLGLDGAANDLVHQPDHRRLAGEVLQPLGILLRRRSLAGSGGGILGDFRVEAFEGSFQLDRHGDDRTHGQPGQRQGAGGAQESAADSARRRGHRCGITVGAGDLGAEQDGVGFGDVAFGDEAELGQYRVQPLPAFGCHPPAAFERPRIAPPALQQQRRQRFERRAFGVVGW